MKATFRPGRGRRRSPSSPAWSGSPDLGLQIPTADLESGFDHGGGKLTLPSIMVISGAAISPLMGRFSLPASRLLIALVNLRLGVWLPNPEHTPSGPPRGGWRHRLSVLLRQPGAGYVFREGLGLTRGHHRYVHVSDGGHWENLGLVELLRRRCTHIVVMDASAGARSSLTDIGRAAAVARAELGVDIGRQVPATPDKQPTAVG